MAYKPIRDYGVIGDCHSAALVGLDGSVDWCCFPRFDSPSVFAAILDDRKGGRFKISPRGQFRSRQRYLGRTNVLEKSAGPLLRRYLPLEEYDGLPGREGAFVFCSFWMVQALARTGKIAEARALFERLAGYTNHVGLYSEMIDPRNGEFLGNFPQAFTHIGHILAARECAVERPHDGARNA